MTSDFTKTQFQKRQLDLKTKQHSCTKTQFKKTKDICGKGDNLFTFVRATVIYTSVTDKMKILSRLILLTSIVLLSCSDDNNNFEEKTNLLVDVYWFNSEIIGTPTTGYSAVSPILFKRDMTVYIGGNQSKWSFIENGKSIKISSEQSNSYNKYEILGLTKTEFHFKHFDGSENFMAELKYRPR
jgi:hypothetical protein